MEYLVDFLIWSFSLAYAVGYIAYWKGRGDGLVGLIDSARDTEKYVQEQYKGYDEKLAALQSSLSSLRAALEHQIERWESVPSGPDYEADPMDKSPVDAVAHLAGLSIKEIKEALAAFDSWGKSG